MGSGPEVTAGKGKGPFLTSSEHAQQKGAARKSRVQGASGQTDQEPFLPLGCLLTHLKNILFPKSLLITLFFLKIFARALLPMARMPLCGFKGPLPGSSSFQLPLLLHVWIKLVKSQLLFAAYVTPSGGKATFSSRNRNPITLKELGLIHETPCKQLRQKQMPRLSILAPLAWHVSSFTAVIPARELLCSW